MASLILRIFLDDIALKKNRPYVFGSYQFKFRIHFIKSVKRVDDLLVGALLYVPVKIHFRVVRRARIVIRGGRQAIPARQAMSFQPIPFGAAQNRARDCMYPLA